MKLTSERVEIIEALLEVAWKYGRPVVVELLRRHRVSGSEVTVEAIERRMASIPPPESFFR